MNLPYLLSRRQFVASATASSAAAFLRPKLLAGQDSVPSSVLAADPERPQFHLLPARNWMNDPNAPIYFNGRYHMFYQYNPLGATWGNMSWNHAVSPDMLHWTHEPLALTRTPGGPDAAGCFSGSALVAEHSGRKRVYALYTGVVRDPQDETIPNEGLKESQCLAWSDDASLLHWTKQPQAVLPAPPDSFKVAGFRDPSVWKQGYWFYMTVGSGIRQVGGCVLLYRSNDLRRWDYMHVLTAGTWGGKPTSNPVADGEMWECPDFFALDGGHVLIYSTGGKVYWRSGKLDPVLLTFKSSKEGLLDLDAFYAPKTQLDAAGRRILWGWIPERRSEVEMRKAGWSGMMSLPRVMNLDPDGTLRLHFLPQTETLRTGSVSETAPCTGVLKSASGEVLCTGRKGSSFELELSCSNTTLLHVTYSGERHCFIADGNEIKLQPHDAPTLHALVDGSVIELIAGERIGYTKRFYFRSATAPEVRVSVRGDRTTLRLWRVSPISPNRLTTPAGLA